MPNYRRVYVPGGTFFFTVVTHRRRRMLTTPLALHLLRKAAREVRARLPFTVVALVVLPDHLHCVWTLPPNDADYSTRWRQIKASFTHEWLRQGGSEVQQSASRARKGERGVWHRRGFEHACRDEKDLKRCTDYVHVNPLKHGLVDKVCEWRWSSFHRYVRLGEYTTDWGSADEWYGDEWQYFE